MSEKSSEFKFVSKNKHTSSSYHKQITYEQVVLMKFGIKTENCVRHVSLNLNYA